MTAEFVMARRIMFTDNTAITMGLFIFYQMIYTLKTTAWAVCNHM